MVNRPPKKTFCTRKIIEHEKRKTFFTQERTVVENKFKGKVQTIP